MNDAINIAYVAKLLADVFGIGQPVYTGVKQNSLPEGIAGPFAVSLKEADPDYDNAPVRFGHKTFGAFLLKGGLYKTWNHKGKLVDIELSDFLMPLATLVDFTRPKTVTKTPTTGGVGTVKELYGLEDWNITISGIIIPDPLKQPGQQTVDEQMRQIQLFHEIAESIDVEGQLFAERSITRIVTESLKFTPVQGHPGMMQYSIDAISDKDFLLEEQSS